MFLGEEIKIWRQLVNMSSLEASLKSEKRLIPYLTFGFPSIEFTERCMESCIRSGADVIELGIPFSDPLADGPIIQQTHQFALQSKDDVSLTHALQFLSRFTKKHDTPVIFMMSYNLVLSYGVDSFFKDAAHSGCRGVVIPDLPVEEAEECLHLGNVHNVAVILLISPLCSPDRMKTIVEQTQGFLYLISSTGLTGERDSFANDLSAFVDQIKEIRDIPTYVGFGVSKETHVDFISSFADGVIVGSHLMKIIYDNLGSPEVALTTISDRISLFKRHLK